MVEITHRSVETNGITMHVAEAGAGPLVVLLHGFPETWFTWRHQMAALAAAGYHVVAPDQRGCGQTDAPESADLYTTLHLVGDVVGLLEALGEGPTVVVGHDWGGPVAWNTALFRPDLLRGVVGVSVPYVPRLDSDLLTTLTALLGESNYQAYFQAVGPAEAELEADVEVTMRRWFHGLSAACPTAELVIPDGGGVLDVLADTDTLPAWLDADDFAFIVEGFRRTGFHGNLNWYRTSRQNYELTAPWKMAPVTTPALFVAGDVDVVYRWPGMSDIVASLELFVPNLVDKIIIDDCGHWTGEERPDELNAALVGFLSGLA